MPRVYTMAYKLSQYFIKSVPRTLNKYNNIFNISSTSLFKINYNIFGGFFKRLMLIEHYCQPNTTQAYHVPRTRKQNHDRTGVISQHGMITRMCNTSQGIPEVL